MKVDVKLSGEGFLFVYGSRHAGPYRTLDNLNPVEVAALLNSLEAKDIEEWEKNPEANNEKWMVKPKDVLAAKIMVEKCISYENQKPKPPAGEAISTHVSRLDASLAGKLVKLNAQIISEQSQKVLPKTLILRCPRCGEECEADLLKHEYREFLEAAIFKDKVGLRQRALTLLNHEAGSACQTELGHRVQIEERGHIDYAVLAVRDLLEEMEKFDQHVYQPRRVHLVGAKVPQSKKVSIKGYVVVDPTTRDLCLLAYEIEPLETQVACFQVTDEDRKAWADWFKPGMDIRAQTAPDMGEEKTFNMLIFWCCIAFQKF